MQPPKSPILTWWTTAAGIPAEAKGEQLGWRSPSACWMSILLFSPLIHFMFQFKALRGPCSGLVACIRLGCVCARARAWVLGRNETSSRHNVHTERGGKLKQNRWPAGLGGGAQRQEPRGLWQNNRRWSVWVPVHPLFPFLFLFLESKERRSASQKKAGCVERGGGQGIKEKKREKIKWATRHFYLAWWCSLCKSILHLQASCSLGWVSGGKSDAALKQRLSL